MGSTTAALAVKKALYDTAVRLWADDPQTRDVLVCFGTPGNFQPEEIVAFTGVSADLGFATMGQQRSRNESITATVVFSVIFGGDEEMELSSQERAMELLGQLEHEVRTKDTTLGGLVQHCMLTQIETDGQTPEEYKAQGRGVDLTARFTAVHRIRN